MHHHIYYFGIIVLPTIAFACSPCPKQGTLIESIRRTSNDNLLAAKVGYYPPQEYAWSPRNITNATIHLDTGRVERGWPEGEEVYHSEGLVAARLPVINNKFNLYVDRDNLSAKLIDITTSYEVSFALPDFDTTRDVLWFGSNEFNLVYLFYPNSTELWDWEGSAVVMIPVNGRPGDVIYQKYPDIIDFPGYYSDSGSSGLSLASEDTKVHNYDDVQLALLPAPCCICFDNYITFYNDTTLEIRYNLNIYDFRGDVDMVIEHENGIVPPNIDDVSVYRIQNDHLCTFYEDTDNVDDASDYYIDKIEISSGYSIQLDVNRDDVLAVW